MSQDLLPGQRLFLDGQLCEVQSVGGGEIVVVPVSSSSEASSQSVLESQAESSSSSRVTPTCSLQATEDLNRSMHRGETDEGNNETQPSTSKRKNVNLFLYTKMPKKLQFCDNFPVVKKHHLNFHYFITVMVAM